MNLLNQIFDFIDSRHLVRRVAFLTLLYMTLESFWWAMEFVSTTAKTGAEVGLMVAAVTAPITLLQKSVIELYNESRK